MELINYFLVFATIQIGLVAYFLITRERIKKEFKSETNLNRPFMLSNVRNKQRCDKKDSYCSSLNLEEELKRNRRQLRRHIMTLNYLTKLENNNNSIEKITPVVDIAKIRSKLHREVIRNAKLVKHYESMVA